MRAEIPMRNAVDCDLASGVRCVHAGNDLDQRRLARAVFADEAMHLACVHRPVDVLECDCSTEALADSSKLENRPVRCRRRPALCHRFVLQCKEQRRSAPAVTRPGTTPLRSLDGHYSQTSSEPSSIQMSLASSSMLSGLMSSILLARSVRSSGPSCTGPRPGISIPSAGFTPFTSWSPSATIA